jgi:subtilisin-like proprotein convertase family protein
MALAIAPVTAILAGLSGGSARGVMAQRKNKEEMTERLNQLDEQINALKQQQRKAPKDKKLKLQLGLVLAEYDALSAAMGGDRASRKGPEGQATVAEFVPQVVPTLPTLCTSALTAATQNTPTAIPTGPDVVSSTLVVAGAGTFLFDLDLTTNLTHTFAADLDITISSPAGTVVTLTTDNGAGNDNVFNGTLWDDDANPAGQVPYVTNNGLATDHAYVNLTTATPLVPEESFGAFIGEDPNGTWTITISDDLAGDGGSLDSWTLNITTLDTAPVPAPVQDFTNSTPLAIPTGPDVVSATLNVAGAGTSLFDLNLTTNLTHTFAADLDITLMSPAGTVVTLTTDNGAGNDNVFNGTLWDDDANPAGQVPYVTNNGLATDHAYVNLTTATPLVPEEAMSAFIGEDPNGTWTVTISDDLAGDGGSLDSWTLSIVTATCDPCLSDTEPPTITCPANVTAVGTPGSPTVVVTFPDPVFSDNCPGVTAACVPPSGSTVPVGTTTITCTATDAAGNTATCSFTVSAFDGRLQDNSAGCAKTVVFDTSSGTYSFCCGGQVFTGTAKVTKKGLTFTLEHNAGDRRVLIKLDAATGKGTATLQSPPGTLLCTITDTNIGNNTCSCP